MNSWDNIKYQRIEQVRMQKNSVEVFFENGDEVALPLKSILPQNFIEENLNLKFNSYEVTLTNLVDITAIPWSKIRVLTDLEFSKHMALQAESQAKDIGKKLKGLREQKNIKANELAERAGLTAQTISRIEHGHTDVSFATLKKILGSMGLTLRDLADYTLLNEFNKEKSLDFLLRKLEKAGIDSNFFINKFIPKRINLEKFKKNIPPLLLDEITTYVKTVFNWTSEQIWSSKDLTIGENASQLAFYKRPANSNFHQIKAYSHYAYYLSKLVIKSTPNLTGGEYPSDIDEFVRKFNNKKITFESCLSVIWELGICVIPLRDKGLFHGASWNIEGRHVIILKQTSNSQAKWLFDLLHELYHVFAHLEEDNTSIIEPEEISPSSAVESTEEAEANSFAHKVLFGNKTEMLLTRCLELSRYKIENLKEAVVKVAAEENIGEDVLSNYLAFRLSYQGENWWGTANKFQTTNPDPYSVALTFLKNNITNKVNNPIEANILSMALDN